MTSRCGRQATAQDAVRGATRTVARYAPDTMDIAAAHAFCAALPGATLDFKWRFEDSVHPVFSVGGRMFAMFSMEKDALVDQLLFKTADDRFLALTDRHGIVAAPYLAKAKWVKLDTPRRLSDVELRDLLTEAHALILAKATKKVQAAILAAALPSAARAMTKDGAIGPASEGTATTGSSQAAAPATSTSRAKRGVARKTAGRTSGAA